MLRARSFFIGVGFVFLWSSVASAAIPQPMHFSGNLNVGPLPFTGTASVTFSLYEQATFKPGEAALWTETQAVSVSLGRFHVQLGSSTSNAIDDSILDGARFLGLTVETDDEMTPRIELASVPFARQAGDAETVGGKLSSDFALSNQTCGTGTVVKGIQAGGTLNCVTDATNTGDITGVTAGTGLIGGGNAGTVTISANAGYLQRRVSTACTGESAIRVISATGGVTCQSTAGTTYSAGAGLVLTNAQFSLSTLGCVAGEVLKRDANNTAWECVADEDTAASLATVAYSGLFIDLNNVPDGLADGDDDTLGDLSCAAGESTSWNAGTGVWECLPASAQVPIGTIIDWWRPNADAVVPAGYQICDGSTIDDSNSPWQGETLPDLTDRFVRGVTSATAIGEAGGDDVHDHTVDINHTHGTVASTSDGGHSHSVDLPALTGATSESEASGVHNHAVGINDYSKSVGSSSAGSHSHSVDPPTFYKDKPTELDGEHYHEWAQFESSTQKWKSFGVGGVSTTVIDWQNGMDTDGAGHYPLGRDGSSSGTYYTNKTNTLHNHDSNIDHNHGSFNSGTKSNHSHNVDIGHEHGTSISSNSLTHRHDVDLGHNHAAKTSSEQAAHNHNVSVGWLGTTNKTTVTGANVPQYVGLLKLMRTR